MPQYNFLRLLVPLKSVRSGFCFPVLHSILQNAQYLPVQKIHTNYIVFLLSMHKLPLLLPLCSSSSTKAALPRPPDLVQDVQSKALHSKENDPVYPKDHLYITRCLLKTSAMSLLKILRFLPGSFSDYPLLHMYAQDMRFALSDGSHATRCLPAQSYPAGSSGIRLPPFLRPYCLQASCSQYNIRLPVPRLFPAARHGWRFPLSVYW